MQGTGPLSFHNYNRNETTIIKLTGDLFGGTTARAV